MKLGYGDKEAWWQAFAMAGITYSDSVLNFING